MRSTAQLLSKIPLYCSFRHFGFPKILPLNYTFLISTQCNSRCLTCNIWKQKHDELAFGEWEKILKSLGKSSFWVTVSGGEPFLQRQLLDFVKLVSKECQPAIINIPTNGILFEKIPKMAKAILRACPETKIVLNLSLDGVGERHDKIRGVPGNFEKAMRTYEELKKLRRYKNFTLGIHTVISKYNVKDVGGLFDFVLNSLKPDQYLTEIAEERIELDSVGLPITPSFEEYEETIDKLTAMLGKKRFGGLGRISRAFRLEYYQFTKNWLGQRPLLPDYAGFASCEITSWGEVWPSCIKGERMGNLRDVGYDLRKIWLSKDVDKIRGEIKEKGTSYPLANAFYTNALFHPPTLIRVLRRIILR